MCPDDCAIGKSDVPVFGVWATYTDTDLVETGKNCVFDALTAGDALIASNDSTFETKCL